MTAWSDIRIGAREPKMLREVRSRLSSVFMIQSLWLDSSNRFGLQMSDFLFDQIVDPVFDQIDPAAIDF